MKMLAAIWLMLCLSMQSAHAQEMDSLPDAIISKTNSSAQFPGGTEALYQYVAQNLRYPDLAVQNNISGKIIVEFVITKVGTVDDIQTFGKPKGFGLEEAAIQVVRTMPKWEPGKMDGKPVNIKYRLPINFSLPEVPDKKRKQTKSTHYPPPPEMRKELKRNPND